MRLIKNYLSIGSIIFYAACSLHADGILEHTVITVSVHGKKKCIKMNHLSEGSHVVSFDPVTFRPIGSTQIHHIIRQKINYIVSLRFADDTHVFCSPYQKMFVEEMEKWIEARKLQPGDHIMLHDHHTLEIKGIGQEQLNNQATTHLLIMSPGDHILAITAHGILTKQSDKVINLQELFERKDEAFAAALRDAAALTMWKRKSSQIYMITRNLPQYGLGKGDLLYLDKLHYDHVEIFNNQGTKPVVVLNLDGTQNIIKTQIAQAEQRTLAGYIN